MYAQVDRFAHLASLVMGKLINEARGEVKFSADTLAYYAPSQSPNRYCRGRESESSLVVVCAKILGAEHKSSSTARQPSAPSFNSLDNLSSRRSSAC